MNPPLLTRLDGRRDELLRRQGILSRRRARRRGGALLLHSVGEMLDRAAGMVAREGRWRGGAVDAIGVLVR